MVSQFWREKLWSWKPVISDRWERKGPSIPWWLCGEGCGNSCCREAKSSAKKADPSAEKGNWGSACERWEKWSACLVLGSSVEDCPLGCSLYSQRWWYASLLLFLGFCDKLSLFICLWSISFCHLSIGGKCQWCNAIWLFTYLFWENIQKMKNQWNARVNILSKNGKHG